MSAFDESPQRPDGPGSTSVAATKLGDFTVSVASLEDWHAVTEWGNAEGWNIGFNDAACFHATDPEGFFIGRVGTRPVSAVSLVNHSQHYAVWGHYLVDPEFRGQGYGRATCKVARPHSGRRAIGCDAMPGMVSNYRRSGAVPVHDTIHYVGRLREAGARDAKVVRIGPEHLDAVAAYDSECFPAYRRGFLSRWLSADGHIAYARLGDGRITGYGVIRPAPAAYRIGPLFADTPQDAEALFDTLTAHLEPGSGISLFAPEWQGITDAFFSARGLVEQFRLVRMYTGAVPETRAERIFAISSLELG